LDPDSDKEREAESTGWLSAVLSDDELREMADYWLQVEQEKTISQEIRIP
jgi:hypothetical protein